MSESNASPVPLLDLAPKLKRPLSLWNPLDYLRLLYWCFFFPQALRWYVDTFGTQEYSRSELNKISFMRLWYRDSVSRNLLAQGSLSAISATLFTAWLLQVVGVDLRWSGIALGFVIGMLLGAISIAMGGISVGVAVAVTFSSTLSAAGGVAGFVARIADADILAGVSEGVGAGVVLGVLLGVLPDVGTHLGRRCSRDASVQNLVCDNNRFDCTSGRVYSRGIAVGAWASGEGIERFHHGDS